jgi:TPR repeat protein
MTAFLAAACQKLSPQQAHFERAFKYFNQGDFTSTLLYLKPLVEDGHPAAQLLMARMYANGQGVPEDGGKAELLRNLAAYQIYKNKNFTPGEMRPANETLKTISDRLDYYVEAGEHKESPPQNLSQLMESLGDNNTSDLQKTDDNSGSAQPEIPIEIPHEQPESVPEAAPVSVPPPLENPAEKMAISGDSRRSEQITLGIVRQAAEGGDPMAMELLSAAYAKGFYGLTPNPDQSRQWLIKAREARHRLRISDETDSLEKVPLNQVWKVFAIGAVLIAIGVWRWWQTRLG